MTGELEAHEPVRDGPEERGDLRGIRALAEHARFDAAHDAAREQALRREAALEFGYRAAEHHVVVVRAPERGGAVRAAETEEIVGWRGVGRHGGEALLEPVESFEVHRT